MKNTLRIALSTALFWSAASQAEVFLGAGIGQAEVDDSAHAVSIDDTDIAWKFYGGMMVTDNFGFEAGWTDMGDMNQGGVDIETEAFYAAGVAAFPINETFSIYGKLGVALWDQDIRPNSFTSSSFDGEDLMYGIGAKYKFMEQFHARLEWEQYDVDLQASAITLGLGLQF